MIKNTKLKKVRQNNNFIHNQYFFLFCICIYIVLLVLLFHINSDLFGYDSEVIKCNEEEIPIWSRGIARSCCNVYPTHFKKFGSFESGIGTDSTYIFKKEIKSGDVIYVITTDFPKFLDMFSRLDSKVRITLVTGAEDIGSPYEIFHPNRPNFLDYKMSYFWPHGQIFTMRQFITDLRLVKWYTQNYDLVGCNSFTCSDIDMIADKDIIDKVIPIPIGLDFHTLSEKKKLSSEQIDSNICQQRNELQFITSRSLPFLQRQLSVYGQFDCSFTNKKSRRMRILTRGEICELLNKFSVDNNVTNVVYFKENKGMKTNLEERKVIFYNEIIKSQFVLAPPGFGVDTHRVWEILLLNSVPIVLSSPLDRLYSMYPIIIIKKWSEVFEPNALLLFQSKIINKFGENPFNSDIKNMLKGNFWIEKIRKTSSNNEVYGF